jgi:hypothetical protein
MPLPSQRARGHHSPWVSVPCLEHFVLGFPKLQTKDKDVYTAAPKVRGCRVFRVFGLCRDGSCGRQRASRATSTCDPPSAPPTSRPNLTDTDDRGRASDGIIHTRDDRMNVITCGDQKLISKTSSPPPPPPQPSSTQGAETRGPTPTDARLATSGASSLEVELDPDVAERAAAEGQLFAAKHCDKSHLAKKSRGIVADASTASHPDRGGSGGRYDDAAGSVAATNGSDPTGLLPSNPVARRAYGREGIGLRTTTAAMAATAIPRATPRASAPHEHKHVSLSSRVHASLRMNSPPPPAPLNEIKLARRCVHGTHAP